MTRTIEPRCPATHIAPVHHLRSVDGQALQRRWRWFLNLATPELEGVELSLWRSDAGVDFFWPPTPGRAAFYRALQRFPGYALRDKFEFRWSAQRMPAQGRLLELGPGRGHFRRHLPPELDWTGVQEGPPGIEHWDVACCFQVLEHLPDPLEALSSLTRGLRPGGEVFLGLPMGDGWLGRARDLVLDAPPHHLTRWTEKGARALVRSAGLEWLESARTPLESWERPLAAMAEHAPRTETDFGGGLLRVLAQARAALRGPRSAEVQGVTLVLRARVPVRPG